MKRALYSIAAIVLIAAASITWYGYSLLFKNNIHGETGYLYIREGATVESFMTDIDSLGTIRNKRSLRRVASIEKLEGSIKPGRYRIKSGMGNREIVRMVKYGWQTPLNITISGNIRTKERLAGILSRKLEADSSSMLRMLNNDSLAFSMGFKPETFIGMFIPDTYEVFWTVTPVELAERFRKEYEKFWNEERRAQAYAAGFTPEQITIIASVVAEETNIREEYPVIAGVYINRLKAGIPLQADPTVKFALNDPSVKRILFKHLQIESPYNTYKNKGLPPGPITIPSAAAIDGVLTFKKHGYFYFCAKPSLDGSHVFASSLAEHGRNARAYQNAISKLKM
ncbi:MAG: endolytic transglycosylase MltG [Bacteroidetes bacterium HGW-Bacteroidetes-10]|nr:MAG: endolytic transglycosylase MltG [Bacteroidetes bacterium HGW-Bacteroidetes-10]